MAYKRVLFRSEAASMWRPSSMPTCSKPAFVDPTGGVRIALENAVWVSSVLLLAEARMTGQMEPKEPAQSPEEL